MSAPSPIWQLVTRILFEENRLEQNASLAAELPDVNSFWEQAISIANVSSVTAAVWSRLSRRGLTGCASDDARDYLASFHDINTGRNEAILEQFLECAAALNREGIVPMPIKGAAYLLSGLYDDPGERFLTDIDIMLPADRADEAYDILRDLGYRASQAERETASNKLVPLIMRGRPAELECHLSAVPEVLEPALCTRTMWAGAVPRAVDGARFVVPAAIDSFVNSFLHAVIIDRCFVLFLCPLRLFHDAHTLITKHGDEIRDYAIIDRATRLGAFSKLRAYAYALYQLSGRNHFPSLEYTMSDMWQFALCRAAAGHQWTASNSAMIRWLIRFDCFSDYSLRKRYGVRDEGLMLHWYRLREGYEMMLRGLRKLQLGRQRPRASDIS